jgi:putative ABC transport system substrate-binding protein
MKKNFFCSALVVLFVALSFPVDAQERAKVSKIGWLGVRPDDLTTSVEVFRRELRELGYVEGKNIAFEYRNADNKLDRLPALADELVRLKVDVLFTPAPFTPALAEAQTAKNATRTIPVVFISSADPVASGLVDSLARPGGNLTGISNIQSELWGKRLEVLKETIPKFSRVAMLWDPQSPTSRVNWKESQVPARELGLQLHSMEVNSADQFESAFKEAIKSGSAALAVTLSPLINSNQKRIAALAAKNRLPAIYARAEFVDNGGLMSYGPDRTESYRRVASMVDKILKGAKPADLPVEQPTKIELVVNLKTAKQIELTIPQNVLRRADKVIK